MKFKHFHRLAMITLAMVIVGCSSDPGTRSGTEKFNGSVVGANGSPVKNVSLTLVPQASGGIQTGAKTGNDGKFALDLIPGKYSFFFEPVQGKEAMFRVVPAKYHSAAAENVVEAVSGKEIEIKLSN